jgi:hypothetical protein
VAGTLGAIAFAIAMLLKIILEARRRRPVGAVEVEQGDGAAVGPLLEIGVAVSAGAVDGGARSSRSVTVKPMKTRIVNSSNFDRPTPSASCWRNSPLRAS